MLVLLPVVVLLLLGVSPAAVVKVALLSVAAGLILCLFLVPDGSDAT